MWFRATEPQAGAAGGGTQTQRGLPWVVWDAEEAEQGHHEIKLSLDQKQASSNQKHASEGRPGGAPRTFCEPE